MRNIREYIKKCLAMCDETGIKYGKICEFKINTRAKKRWGLCKRTTNGFVIEVNSILLDEAASDEIGIIETLLHEIIHTCDKCFNHGAEWKRIASILNKKYNLNIKRTSNCTDKGVDEEIQFEKMEYKYIVTCTCCGNKTYRSRTSNVIKNPHNYRCSCGGKLEVTTLM